MVAELALKMAVHVWERDLVVGVAGGVTVVVVLHPPPSLTLVCNARFLFPLYTSQSSSLF
jgi:hypothetical protein